MRTSNFLIATQKETPADAEVISHQLMLRAGLIRKLASGSVHLAATGTAGAAQGGGHSAGRNGQIRRPGTEYAGDATGELWQESGRWEQYGPELLRIRTGTSGILPGAHP